MTHSIISLGKAFPLDSLQRAAVSPVGSVGASKYLQPFEVATGDPHLCTLAPGKLSRKTARPAFSVGHFDPLILLQVESSGHLDHLIFTTAQVAVLQVKPKLLERKLRWLRYGCNQVILLGT